MSDATITIHIPRELQERLTKIARHTGRSSSLLINDAITRYVEMAGSIIEAIHSGKEDARAARVNAYDQEMEQFRAMVACMAGETAESL